MDGYRATAFYLAVWYAFLATLGVVLLIALNDVGPASAFLIAANSALLFALLLMLLVARLNDRRITRGQFWRTLPPRTRPSDDAGRLMARRALEETWLRFAKGAAMLAIVFSGFAYASNNVSASAWATALRQPAMAQIDSGGYSWTGYRSARLLPMN
jgi:hypothetical protein